MHAHTCLVVTMGKSFYTKLIIMKTTRPTMVAGKKPASVCGHGACGEVLNIVRCLSKKTRIAYGDYMQLLIVTHCYLNQY